MSVEQAATNCETLVVTVGHRADYVATVAIDRPNARNALNDQVRSDLSAMFDVIEDSDVRVVVLTGADGASAFVSGADVTELRERDMLDQREISNRRRIYERIAEYPLPVIARINGHALGGGCELAQACDVRIARQDAKLGQPELNLGIIPGGGGTQRLPRLVGEGQALRLILTGELVDADEAAGLGLVEEVHDGDTFDERVTELAASMAEKSPVTLELAKDAVRASSRLDIDAGIDYESELFAQSLATADKNEGIDAFLEDREPEWTGQ